MQSLDKHFTKKQFGCLNELPSASRPVPGTWRWRDKWKIKLTAVTKFRLLFTFSPLYTVCLTIQSA